MRNTFIERTFIRNTNENNEIMKVFLHIELLVEKFINIVNAQLSKDIFTSLVMSF